MKVKQISREDAVKSMAEKTAGGKWKELFDSAEKTGKPFMVSEVTRGQLASIYRIAKDKGWDYRANYKNLEITVIPPELVKPTEVVE